MVHRSMYPEPPIPPTVPPEPDLQSRGITNKPPWNLPRTTRPAWTHNPPPPPPNNAASSSSSRNTGDPARHTESAQAPSAKDNNARTENPENKPQTALPTQPSVKRGTLFEDGEYYMD
eukprot:1060802-Prorocentrum_lima.AAC.1